jgi:hemerythrin-like domain-containing protein
MKLVDRVAFLVEQDQGILTNDMQELMNFMSDFSDYYHHTREEKIVFQALSDLEEIKELLEEHKINNDLIQKMREVFEDDYASLSEFSDYAREYTEKIREHIHKENNEIFPLVEKKLSREDDWEILEKLKKFDKEVGEEKINTYIEKIKLLRTKFNC